MEVETPATAGSRAVVGIDAWRLLLLLCGFSFVLSLNNGILSPLLPEIGRDLGTSITVAGQLASISLLVCAVAALVTGPLSDIYGRRPFLLGGLCLIGFGSLTVAVAPTFTLALLGRAAGGLGFVMAVALALAGDSFQGRSRDRASARMLAAEALAWVAGVPIIAVATQLAGWRSSLAGFGLLALALAVLAAFILPRRPSLSQAKTPKQALWAIWQEHHSRPDLLLVLVANGLRNTYWVGFTTYAGAFYVAMFGLATWQLAPILAVCAIGYIVGTEGGGRLVSRLGPARLTAIGCGSAALLLAVLPQISLLKASLIVVAASCVFSGAANSALIAWILRLASEQRGATLALNSALTNLGAALGAAACGAGVLLLGYTGLGLASASLAVLAAGAAAWSAARGAGSATCAAIRS